MKLFECFGAAGFHTCIATTFDLSFDAYETMVLARLREARCNNNIVVADPRMIALALQSGSGLPKYAGKRYSVVDAQTSGDGVFHPKIILQLGRKTGRLIVGSANLTAAGLAGNLEVVGEVNVSEGDLAGVPLVRAAMAYVARTMDPSARTARQQIEWAVARTLWLRNGIDSQEPVVDGESGLTMFLAHQEESGIAERFSALIGGEKVRRLVVVSPYWDPNLSALKSLRDDLKPTLTAVLLQPKTKLFPVHALGKQDKIEFHDLGTFRRAQSRFVHAKLVIAQTNRYDHVLYGSANCTRAALGSGSHGGSNEEASLYRRMKRGEAVEVLQLEQALSEESSIALTDIPKFSSSEDIPLKEVQSRLAGRFELRSGVLLWWPKADFDNDDARVDLFDAEMKIVGAGLKATRASDVRRVAILSGTSPAFARVRIDGLESGLALVTVDEAIYESQRRVKSTSIRNALEHFDDEEATEGLWLLEVIDDIHRAEAEETEGDPAPTANARTTTEQARNDRTLSYEDFIKGRRMVDPAGAGESSLATSYADAIRSALNFFSGRGGKRRVAEEEEGRDTSQLFDMGDETPDGEDLIETGEEPAPAKSNQRAQEAARKRAIERRRRYYRDTAERISAAVNDFLEHAREKGEREGLAGIDLLRLRALMMVVLTAGTARTNVIAPALDKPMSKIQVLPIQGDGGWPRLAMQLLYEFFRRPPPLAFKTTLPASDNGALPVDVAECWATCYWAACAVQTATDHRGVPFVAGNAAELARQVYATIGLSQAEAASDVIASVVQALSKRLSPRLGVDAERLWAMHLRAIATPNPLVPN